MPPKIWEDLKKRLSASTPAPPPAPGALTLDTFFDEIGDAIDPADTTRRAIDQQDTVVEKRAKPSRASVLAATESSRPAPGAKPEHGFFGQFDWDKE
jgi:hypothetical protein